MRRRLPVLLLLAACAPEPAAQAPCAVLERSEPPRPRSLVLVVADTLRRDRIGAYGGPPTPAFDAFARESLLFRAATTQAPWTKPAIASLFTGLTPSRHGVLSHADPRVGGDPAAPRESDALADALPTLAEHLAQAGWSTAAFVANPWLRRDLGFAQGFGVYDDSFAANQAPGRVVTAAGLDWLRARADDPQPFFVYLHYMDPHEPYRRVPPGALAARRRRIEADARTVPPGARAAIAKRAVDMSGARLAALGVPPNLATLELVYDQGVAAFDRALGRFLEGLAEQPGAAEVAVVVTSDHGEALYERGWGSHGHGLFDEETAIPLAARLPGVRALGSLSCPVGLIDLPPTLCDYLGVSCPGERDGVSLFAEPEPGERALVTEGVIRKPGNRAARTRRYKLLWEPDGPPDEPRTAGEWRLYDLASDPGETRPRAPEGDPAAEAALARLRAALEARAALAPLAGVGARVPLDEATRQRLEALGYVGD